MNGQVIQLKRLRAGHYLIEGTDWAIVRSPEGWIGTRGGIYGYWELVKRFGKNDWCIEGLGAWSTLHEAREWVERDPELVGLGI